MGAVLGHARVSTGDQDLSGQRLRLEAAGALRIFGDVRLGKGMNREGLRALLDYARPGDSLAGVRLDRLDRSRNELLAIMDDLKGRGVALLSLEERLDTSSAAGELVFLVFGAIAHVERQLIAERTKDGIAAARAKGRHPGRQPVDRNKVAAALKLVEAGLTPTHAVQQVGLGRATRYRKMAVAGVRRSA